MRINPYAVNTSVEQVRSTNDSTRPLAKANATTSATTTEADGFSRSSALTSYLAALKDVPEVREDVVAAVSAKVNNGEYQTQTAFAEAATALDDVNNAG